MFSAATLAQARAEVERARAAMRNRSKDAVEPIDGAVAALETASVAYAISAADRARARDGRERDELMPLLVGAALHAFALFRGGDARASQHAQALANGALAACAYRAGLGASPTERVSVEAPKPRSGRTVEVTVARLSVTSWP
jgi:hypothetical protein